MELLRAGLLAATILSGGTRTSSFTAPRAAADSAAPAVRPLDAPLAIASPAPHAHPAHTAFAPEWEWEGEVRMRSEARTLLDYRVPGADGRPATDVLGERGNVTLLRTEFGATLPLAPHVRARAGLQDARRMGAEDPWETEAATPELDEAWLEADSLAGRRLSLRVGRQVLAYAGGRVLGEGAWGNDSPALDGARVRWAASRVRAEGFAVSERVDRGHVRDRFATGGDVRWLAGRVLDVEAYHLQRQVRDADWLGGAEAGGVIDGTSGLLARLALGPVELFAEGARQRGTRVGEPVAAWAGAASVTFDLRSRWRTHVVLGQQRASGDRDPADGVFTRFVPVSLGAHDQQGALDVVGASNRTDSHAAIEFFPGRDCSMRTAFHFLSLASAADAWVDGEGRVVREGASGTTNPALGRELDSRIRWTWARETAFSLGVSRFWRGEFVRRTGGGADTVWGWAQLERGF